MMPTPPPCRFCSSPLKNVFVDLGMSPLANSFVRPEAADQMERFFPLKVFVCRECFLVQLPKAESPSEIFGDYVYFSSFSDSWVEHCRRHAERMIADFGIGTSSRVIEIASNDGYLLKHFKNRNVPVLGIEPAQNVAKVAEAAGIETRVCFFGQQTASNLKAEGLGADLLIANNVFAHVPDLNDFVAGMKTVLNPDGFITIEFPHLMRLVEQSQFDTIYHEHFSYFSLSSARKVLAHHGLRVFDVEQLPTHGGSLRLFVCHEQSTRFTSASRVSALLSEEQTKGYLTPALYEQFAARVREVKYGLLELLISLKREGASIVAYGAAAKGNTLLNFCGIRNEFLDYVVDRSPHKQGLFLPGTRLPVYAPEKIRETKPSHLLILPWNLREEIMSQMSFIREWGGKFVVPIPSAKVLA